MRGSRVKPTPVPDASPRLPNTIAMTVTAVPHSSGTPWMRRYSVAFLANQESKTAVDGQAQLLAHVLGERGWPVRAAISSW